MNGSVNFLGLYKAREFTTDEGAAKAQRRRNRHVLVNPDLRRRLSLLNCQLEIEV